jgi:hypothetical protein
MRENRSAYKVLVGSLEGKRPLGRSVRRWEFDIDMHVKEVRSEVVDWTGLD